MNNSSKLVRRRMFLLELAFLRIYDDTLGTRDRKRMVPGNDSPITYLEEWRKDDFGN